MRPASFSRTRSQHRAASNYENRGTVSMKTVPAETPARHSTTSSAGTVFDAPAEPVAQARVPLAEPAAEPPQPETGPRLSRLPNNTDAGVKL